MDQVLFFFPWLASQAGDSAFWLRTVAYAAWMLDSYAGAVLALLLIVLLSSIPKKEITDFLSAVVYTVLVFLHFDAAHWRSTLPESALMIVTATIAAIAIPALSFIITGWAWRARHSN